jgi:hypothetical protein
MPPVGFEPTIPASALPQTYALDRAATGIRESKKKTDVKIVNMIRSIVQIACKYAVTFTVW